MSFRLSQLQRWLAVPCLLTAALSSEGRSQTPSNDLTKMNLEDLMQVEVSSVSKKERSLAQTAAAIFVISQEDIARSGATSIPDLLRMVPGMDVAQINSNAWATSARGFNERFGNELLVMIDGRTVYVPTFGGVFWEVIDLPLEDIDRIEVVRGPGGSVWGANAVNGVINILTKSAASTHGVLTSVGAGNSPQEFGVAQYGGAAGKSVDYRVYSKFRNEPQFTTEAGGPGGDGWHVLRGGMRVDARLSGKDELSLEGNLYTGRESVPTAYLPSVISPDLVDTNLLVNLSGGFAQALWSHQFSGKSSTSLMVSYDGFARTDLLDERRHTVDVDFQHNLSVGERNMLTWGLGYRHSASHTVGDLTQSLDPPDLDTNLYSGFMQDEIALYKDKLYLTLGTKFEKHYYVGFVALPSARMAWMLDKNTTLWGAVSRAERTPAATDTSERTNSGSISGAGGTPVLLSTFGNPDIHGEGLVSFELGARKSFKKRLKGEISTYFNRYDHQQTEEPAGTFFEPTPLPPHFVQPNVLRNLMHGNTYGFELSADWKVTDGWKLSAGYAFERIHMHLDRGSQDDDAGPEADGASPVNSAQVRSHYELFRGLSWDLSAYFVGRLREPEIPSYTRLDTQLSWRLGERLTLSGVGQNLLKGSHLEFDDSPESRATLIPRSAYFKLTWRH